MMCVHSPGFSCQPCGDLYAADEARESDGRPMFAMDADLTVYWPWVRPCWEEGADA